jgi:hypothetical protein
MSIDSIVKISIETKSLSMAQKGFGVPLILGKFGHPDEWRVKTFADASELLDWETDLIKFDSLNPDLSPEEKEKELKRRTEALAKAKSEKEELLRNTAVFKAVQLIFSQNPRVQKLKIGRIKDQEDIASAFSSICIEDEDFYGVLFPEESSSYAADAEILASFIAQKRMILGLDVNSTTQNIAINFKDKKNDRVFCIFSPNKDYLASAWMGKMLPEAPGASSWAFRELKEVKAYGLSAHQTNELEKNNINRYLGIKGVGVTLDGKMSSGKFIDITHGIDWLHVRIQERLFRLLVLNKKIPYTLKGIDLVRCEIIAQLKEAVYQGVLAADPEPVVSAPSIEEVDEQTRSDRVLPKIRFSGRLAGAIHKIEIQGTVTA